MSRQLASQWTAKPDWPEPFAKVKAGTFWRTDEVLAWGDRHERKPGQGPRPAGDPRPPSVQKKAARRTQGRKSAV